MNPFLAINMAMSVDGKVATPNRTVTSFGSPRDLAHLYELRATADAIVCGSRTVEETSATLGNGGDAYLKMRQKAGLASYPVRVVVSGAGTLASNIPLWKAHPSPVVVLTSSRIPSIQCERLRSLAESVWVSPSEEIDFSAAFSWLAASYRVQRIMVEGGPTLNDALFRADLVDELHLTICPRLVGGWSSPTIVDGIGQSHLAYASNLRLTRRRSCRGEIFLVYARHPKATADALPRHPSRFPDPPHGLAAVR